TTLLLLPFTISSPPNLPDHIRPRIARSTKLAIASSSRSVSAGFHSWPSAAYSVNLSTVTCMPSTNARVYSSNPYIHRPRQKQLHQGSLTSDIESTSRTTSLAISRAGLRPYQTSLLGIQRHSKPAITFHSTTMTAMLRNDSVQGFSVSQPNLGAALQFIPAMGSQLLDELIHAYIPGDASIQDKRSFVSMDFFEYSRLTGETFRYYPVAARNTATSSASSSPAQDSGYASQFVSPVISDGSFSTPASVDIATPASFFQDTVVQQAPKKAPKKAVASSSRSPANDFSHIPGMKIMTRDGLDITNSASRGCKTKEQRDHAHLMRIIKACDASAEPRHVPTEMSAAEREQRDREKDAELGPDPSLKDTSYVKNGHLYPYGQKQHPDPRVPRSIIRESVLYVTVEPCVMCAGLLRQLGIRKVYFGAVNDKFGGAGGVFSIHLNSIRPQDRPYIKE
ncbi:hypothetical protein BN1723_018033, partial [Verticillium longisporum]